MTKFKLHAPFKPMGDQPQAIDKLVDGLNRGLQHQTLLGATGTGKSIGYADPVFIGEQIGSETKQVVCSIGTWADQLFEQYHADIHFDGESEVLDSAIINRQFFTQAFDPNTGTSHLMPVQSIIRHAAPAAMYHLQTDCGRSIHLTGDHNLWVLRDGALQLIDTADARDGDYLPLPLKLLGSGNLTTLQTQNHLQRDSYVRAQTAVLDYMQQHGSETVADVFRQAGLPHKMHDIYNKTQSMGIPTDVFQYILDQTNHLGGLWETEATRLGGRNVGKTIPAQIQLTPTFLRFLGYYIAEGCSFKAGIALANRNPLIRTVIEDALNELGIEFFVVPSSDYRVNARLLSDFLSNECGSVARNKHLPSFWANLENNDLALLLQAYFDGDGTVGRASDVSITTASSKLASDVCYALYRFGIWARITKRWKRATNTDHAGDWYYYVTISGQDNLRLFHQQIGFAVDYKQSALEQLLQREGNSNVDIVPINGSQLRWLRQQLGLYIRELGNIVGFSQAGLTFVELEQRRPQRTTLINILHHLRDIAQNSAVSEEWWHIWQQMEALCHLRWTPISHVEQIEYPHQYVYDLCVPQAETFLAGNGGIFVHNTFTVAEVVQRVQRPTLVMAHNKTLAAQLYAEFKEFFPENAVGYFVSYYDAYTPEAYVPSKDLYIEKEAQINEEIDRLRHEATQALFTRRDVIIVASVSAIYGLGSPTDYGQVALPLRVGEVRNRDKILRTLIDLQFERNDIDFHRGTFRVRGDTLEIFPANAETAFRVEMWGDEIERIVEVDPLTGEILATKNTVEIFPAKHFVTTADKMRAAINDIRLELEDQLKVLEGDGKVLEAARLKQRTMYDLEIMEELGYCSGIENYSRHMDRRAAGQTPWTLLDYFPDDFLLVVDESHMSIPQIRGMFNGDRSRKQTLVDFGFRLPSALDNRPLMFDEFSKHVHQAIYVSATPAAYEYQHSTQVVEQIIRPTGLIDPVIEVRRSRGQIDDLLGEIKQRVDNGTRAIVTTLTKRMAEDLTDYLKEMGIRTQYLHSDVDTMERVDILRDLRLGVFDAVVGINLLREGLDLPEVSLVAILDADKAGFLRSESALIQTIGRAARHIDGTVLMYADAISPAMQYAINETKRRRTIQETYNREHGIEPRGIVKSIRDLSDKLKKVADEKAPYSVGASPDSMTKDELFKLISETEKQMKQAAKDLEFEKAAMLRDQITELRQTLALMDDTALVLNTSHGGKQVTEAKADYGTKRKIKGRSRGKL